MGIEGEKGVDVQCTKGNGDCTSLQRRRVSVRAEKDSYRPSDLTVDRVSFTFSDPRPFSPLCPVGRGRRRKSGKEMKDLVGEPTEQPSTLDLFGRTPRYTSSRGDVATQSVSDTSLE